MFEWIEIVEENANRQSQSRRARFPFDTLREDLASPMCTIIVRVNTRELLRSGGLKGFLEYQTVSCFLANDLKESYRLDDYSYSPSGGIRYPRNVSKPSR